MRSRYARTNLKWETDRHPHFETHYLASVDVFDTWTDRKVETLKALSTENGTRAVSEAVDRAIALIRKLEGELPTKDQVFAAVCACSVAKEQNNAHRDCIAKELGIAFAPHVDRHCEPLEQEGLVEVQAPFVRLTTAGLAQCRKQTTSGHQEPPIAGVGQSWEL